MSKPLIFDLGTYQTKAGFADLNKDILLPDKVVPTIVGSPKLVKVSSFSQKDNFYVGHEALKRSPLLSLQYPVEHGIVVDWDEASLLIDSVLTKEMGVKGEELTAGLMMMEAPLNPRRNRESLAELMFEQYRVPLFYI